MMQGFTVDIIDELNSSAFVSGAINPNKSSTFTQLVKVHYSSIESSQKRCGKSIVIAGSSVHSWREVWQSCILVGKSSTGGNVCKFVCENICM